MKMLLIGYKQDNRKFTLLNLLINYTQLVIYKDLRKAELSGSTNQSKEVNK